MTQEQELIDTMHDKFVEHLIAITNGLMDMANYSGRTNYTKNGLLMEAYDLMDEEVKTLQEWHDLGRYVKEREHGYLFWDNNGDVVLKYSDEQLLTNDYYDNEFK